MDAYLQIILAVIALVVGVIEIFAGKSTAFSAAIQNIDIAVKKARKQGENLGLSGVEQKELSIKLAKELFGLDLTKPKYDAIRSALVLSLDQIQAAAQNALPKE